MTEHLRIRYEADFQNQDAPFLSTSDYRTVGAYKRDDNNNPNNQNVNVNNNSNDNNNNNNNNNYLDQKENDSDDKKTR